MPIYTYRCKKCGKEFDWLQSINSEPLTVCPKEICEEHNHEQSEVERIFNPNVGLIFKGSGFYLTDYSRKNSTTYNGHNGKNGHTSNGHQTAEKSANQSKTDKTTV